MATHGIFQLKKLAINYCPQSGSSRGVRDFLLSHIIPFAKSNPQIAFETSQRRGKHPFLRAEYLEGTFQNIGIKNNTPKEILNICYRLRSRSSGITEKFAKPVVSGRKSIQGRWNPEMPLHEMKFDVEDL
mmetsp:Transcript_4923/g.7427  ORF Transcript_4923/g.7427 Transcript_4923/m.7427 type:complete len:130 (-) Transcript_4923:318-707(-)